MGRIEREGSRHMTRRVHEITGIDQQPGQRHLTVEFQVAAAFRVLRTIHTTNL